MEKYTSGRRESSISYADITSLLQMLNCICGMVEKTQSAISILQQRQAEIVDIRTTEELVAEVQTKASIAIMEVKQAALEDIRQAEAQNKDKVGSLNKEEVNYI